MGEDINDDNFITLLGEPYNSDDINENSSVEQVEIASYELYKETTMITAVVVNIFKGSSSEHPGFTRDQAINTGLLVRISKLMETVLQLSAKGNRGDVLAIINRCILESVFNLQFLIIKDDPKYYDKFVEFSLGPERELYDLIKANISARGGTELPIEKRMLGSIERVARLSGVEMINIKSSNPDWGGTLRDKLKALGREEYYLHIQRIPSHMIHGSWVDLLLHHLEEKEGLLAPKSTWTNNDARDLNPIAIEILKSIKLYIQTYFPNIGNMKLLIQRVNELIAKIERVDDLHELVFNKKSKI